MSISVNGQSQVPPGFRFHPTEEELLHYYLKKKVSFEKIDLDVIQDVDLNKLEPWDIQEKCKVGTTPQNDWYFFSHKDKKYPTGTRTNRATASGFWKATGRDKVIYGGANSTRIGMRKTLVFYKGRAPHGQKSDWIMHEYRLDDNTDHTTNINVSNAMGDQGMQEEGWVVCRVFKKKNQISHKSTTSSSSPTPIMMMRSTSWTSNNNESTLEEMLQAMAAAGGSTNRPSTVLLGRSTNHELLMSSSSSSPDIDNYNNNNMRRFMKLPSLHQQHLHDSSTSSAGLILSSNYHNYNESSAADDQMMMQENIQDWAALDRLVASHLINSKHHDITTANFSTDHDHHNNINTNELFCNCPAPAAADNHNVECDLWSFTRPSNDQLCHLPNVPV